MPRISHPLPVRWRSTAASVLSHVFKVTISMLFFLSIHVIIFFVFLHFICRIHFPSDDAPLIDFVGPVSAVFFFDFMSVFLFLFSVVIIVIAADEPTCFALGPRRGPLCQLSGRRGLDPTVFPTVIYSAVKQHRIGQVSLECAVCLAQFEDDETLRLIPKCEHAFHPDCIGKWLASHTTCPVCRANLAPQPAVHSTSQLAKSSAELPLVEVKVQAVPSNGGATERSPREGRQEQIQPPDLWDMNESGSFNNHNQTRGSGRIQKFPRSHSTGHSLVRPGEDTERFTLKLPAEVRKQLMDQPGLVLPLEPCSRQGYRRRDEESSRGMYFCRPDQLDRAVKSERLAFDRISPGVAADTSGGSSGGSVQ